MELSTKTIDVHGNIEFRLNGLLHRTDGPAIEYTDGNKSWYINGKFHRTDGPAIEWANGTKVWYINGRHHRTDGPAVEYASGTKVWYIDGKAITVENYRSFVNDYLGLINQFLAYWTLNE